MTIPSELKRRVRAAANGVGLDVTRIASKPFGQDVWLDVERLSLARRTPIRTVFDVGANVGDTAIAVRSRFPGARVLAFEPHPRTYEELCARVAGHEIEPFKLAFGEARREASLYEYRFSTLNSLVENAPYAVRFRETPRKVPVLVGTVDDFCSENRIESVDVLKIDAEGYDLQVLRGARTALAQGRVAFVYTEFNDLFEHPGASGGALLPICELLYASAFQLVATYTEQVFLEGDLFIVSNALFARRSTGVRRRPKDAHAGSQRTPRPSERRHRRVVRRHARILVPPLAGVAAFAATAALAETFSDRDWSLSGLEWPTDFVIAVLLVCLVPLVLGVARFVVDALPGHARAAPNGQP